MIHSVHRLSARLARVQAIVEKTPPVIACREGLAQVEHRRLRLGAHLGAGYGICGSHRHRAVGFGIGGQAAAKEGTSPHGAASPASMIAKSIVLPAPTPAAAANALTSAAKVEAAKAHAKAMGERAGVAQVGALLFKSETRRLASGWRAWAANVRTIVRVEKARPAQAALSRSR